MRQSSLHRAFALLLAALALGVPWQPLRADEPARPEFPVTPDASVSGNTTTAAPSPSTPRSTMNPTAPDHRPGPVEALATEPLGGPGGTRFNDHLAPPARLVGIKATIGQVGAQTVIRSIQPIYSTPHGQVLGQAHGVIDGEPQTIVARPGYAVAGLEVRSGDLVNSVRVGFCKLDAHDEFDPSDSYFSDSVGGTGGTGGSTERVGFVRFPVIGLDGRSSNAIDSLGLVLGNVGMLTLSHSMGAPSGINPSPGSAISGGTGGQTIALRDQASIKALAVRTADDGRLFGFTSDVIATVRPSAQPARSFTRTGRGSAQLLGQAGQEMRTALTEAERAVRTRHPDWGDQPVEISFGEKYSPKDGGSAGAAFAMLLDSLIEGTDPDPGVAVTGDITVDSHVRKVGGVAAKLRGAELAKCSIALIPADNADAVTDAALLYSEDLLWDVQVFSMATLDEGQAILRRDRSADLKEALQLFDTLRSDPKLRHRAGLRAPETRETLKKILTLAPNHLSARYFLDRAATPQAPTLTVGTSLYEFARAVVPAQRLIWQPVPALATNPAPGSGGSGGSAATPSNTAVPHLMGVNDHADAAVMQSISLARKALLVLQPMVNPNIASLVNKTLEFLSTYENYEHEGTTQQLVEDRRQSLLGAFDELSANREVLEKLVKDGTQ